LKALVAAGVELDRHYVYQVCTPSRMSFLSGRLPVHTPFQLGNYCNAKEGIPHEMTTIVGRMKAAGYDCHQLGKWE
jgi:arylsulfatase A-like enzyme